MRFHPYIECLPTHFILRTICRMKETKIYIGELLCSRELRGFNEPKGLCIVVSRAQRGQLRGWLEGSLKSRSFREME